jgi:N-acylglucosamine-6-phosphate 2-epimerase
MLSSDTDLSTSSFADWFASLRGGLIVSCQARDNEPTNDPAILAAMAKAAVLGGACAIRANKPANIRAIRQAVDVPIFGIFKYNYPDSPIYITPTITEARAIVEAGCDVVTIQATDEPRPNGQTLAAYIAALKREFSLPIMADVSTGEEGVTAAELGANIVATTMAGYTPYSRQLPGPDFELIRELAATVSIPIIAEGRISTPNEAREALDMGADAVVVGSMITRPNHITAHFLQGMRGDS